MRIFFVLLSIPCALPCVPRSVAQLRAWVTELDSAGVPVTGGEEAGTGFFGRGNGGGGGGGGEGASTQGERGRGIALTDGRHTDDTYMRTDLEGGSRATTDGRVPVLVVGNKEDVGESMRSTGSALASELGAGHVSVVRESGGGCFSYCPICGENSQGRFLEDPQMSRLLTIPPHVVRMFRLTSSSVEHRRQSSAVYVPKNLEQRRVSAHRRSCLHTLVS